SPPGGCPRSKPRTEGYLLFPFRSCVLLAGCAMLALHAQEPAPTPPAASARTSAPAKAPAPAPLRVVLLGTGYPRPDPERAGPATAVVAGETVFLVDAG